VSKSKQSVDRELELKAGRAVWPVKSGAPPLLLVDPPLTSQSDLFSLGRGAVKESLPVEKAAKDRFLMGVFFEARRDSELNQEALLVNRVPIRRGDSLMYESDASF